MIILEFIKLYIIVFIIITNIYLAISLLIAILKDKKYKNK